MHYLVVLGYGIDENGNIPPIAEKRVEEAVRLYKEGVADRLVFSGAYSFYQPKKPVAEAVAMRSSAISKGVPQHHIFVEAESDDSITNAMYTLKLLNKLPDKWSHITVVMSELQHARAVIAFERVFEDYKNRVSFKSIPDLNLLSPQDYLRLKKIESYKKPFTALPFSVYFRLKRVVAFFSKIYWSLKD